MTQIIAILAWCRKYHDLVAAVAIVLAVSLSFNIGKRLGAKRAHEQDAAKAAQALQQAEQRYRERETTHAQEISELRRSYAASAASAAAVDTATSRDLAVGAKRLRLPIASRCPNSATASAASPRVDDTTSAELTSKAAAALYTITADGDAAIRQLGALQDWAREAVKLCNGQR